MEVPLMGIEWFRDLVICIAGLVLAGVLIFIAVMAYSLYRKAKTTLNSAEAIVARVQRFSACIEEEAVKPLVQVVALIQGIRQGVNTFSTLFKKNKEGGRDV
jgi:uncharacterized protein YoxC